MIDRKKIILILGVFLIFAFFRFYNLYQRLNFDWDQEYYSYEVKKIINGKLTLIGPRVNNDRSFFLGPYFFYLLVPFYLLSNLHPRGLVYYVVFYNILFFIISFYILKKIFDFSKTIFFLLFWSVNPLLIVFDITPWNVNWAILGIFIAFFFLYRIYNRQNKYNLNTKFFLIGLFLGLFLNFHLQFVFIIFFWLLALFFIFKKNLKYYFKKIIFLLGGIFFSFLPILLFDFRHNFLNIRLFFDFFFINKNIIPERNAWFAVYINSFSPLFIKKDIFFGILFYLSILFFSSYTIIKNKNKFQKLFLKSFLGIWLIFPIIFYFLGKRPSEYYFYFLYPFIFLVLIDFFFLLKKQYFFIFYLIFLVIANLTSLRNTLKSYSFGLYYKEKAIKQLKELIDQSKDFNISFDTPLGLNNGFNYLIDYYQIKQSKDFSDPLIEIRIPPQPTDIKINQIGLKIPKEVLKK